MPLVPPADHSRAFFALAVGAALAIFAWTITRSTLPQVGDNVHSLPHGGYYRDGTKTIHYGGPGISRDRAFIRASPELMWLVVIALIVAIWLSNKVGQKRTCCH
ncbi:MAG: TGB2 protein [Xinjiang sediment betaflexivirus 1]|nr:MAG: TGB2 protein [Xinjiang sediment betaflexivirus 1]